MLQSIAKLIKNLEPIKGVSFVSTTYTNKEGETSSYLFNVGVSLENAKRKDLETVLNAEYKANDKYDEATFNKAKEEVVKSLRISLGIDAENISKTDIEKFNNRSKGQKDAYTHIGTTGLKVHNETSKLYVFGMKVKKTTIVEGEYKADTRRPKTIAKDDLRKGMKSDKYRQFEIENAEHFTLSGDTIVF
jgi:hypothetical protein